MADALRMLWERWKLIGKKIGDFQARLLLTFFYFVLLSPFALGLRRWGDRNQGGVRGWRSKEAQSGTSMEQAARQF